MVDKGYHSSYDIIEESLKEDKLYELFIGEFIEIKSPYASVPIDDEFVFVRWVHYVERNENKEYLWMLFKEIIIKMSMDENMCWFTIYYLYLFLSHFKKKQI